MIMLIRIFLFFLSVSCAPNPFKEDYMHWFLKTHRNPKIDPCENFYRHVCPVGVSVQDTLTTIHRQYARSWIQNGRRFLQKEKEMLEAILEMGDFASKNEPAARRRRMAYQANENDTIYYGELSQSSVPLTWTTKHIAWIKYQVIFNLQSTLADRIAMLYDIRKNPKNPLFGEKFTRIEHIGVDLLENIVKKVQASNQHSMEFKKHLKGVIQKLTVTMAFIHETDEILQLYKETVQEVATKRKELARLNLTFMNGLVYFHALTQGLDNFEDSLLVLIESTAIANAQNLLDQVTLPETFFLPNLLSSASLSTILAHYGYILGHEIGHSFIRRPSASYSAFERDPTFAKNILCVRRMMEKACILWGESSCGSGLLTIGEDGPDVFGMSSAYELLQQYLGGKLVKYAYKDLKITKEQLFFYSAAVLWCRPYANAQHRFRDGHSSSIIRVNGVYAMMPEFRKAFNCKKHQLMVQLLQECSCPRCVSKTGRYLGFKFKLHCESSKFGFLIQDTYSVSCAPNPFKEDYIHWFLKTHRNPKIDPCENFYRHVCPVAISNNDTLMSIHNKYARRWIQNGKEVMKKEKETLEAILEMGDFASQRQADRRRRQAFQANEDDTIYDDGWSRSVYGQIAWLKHKVVKNLLFTLPFRIAMLYDIRKNPENPLFGEKFTRIEKISLDLMELIGKKVQASKRHSKKFKKYLNDVIQQLTVTMAFFHETDEIIEFYKETVKQLSSNMNEFERLNLTHTNGLPLFDKLTKGLGDFQESLFALIEHTAIPNAQNFRDQVTMAETLFLPNLIANASLSTILGHYGYILGHEIGHSFVQNPYVSPDFARDPTFVKNILCVRRMMEKACILWGESRCNSGLLTMDEDGPDVFGMSSAYTLLKQYLGSNLRKYEYKDLKITKEQLFFYSTAVLWCNPYADSQHYPRDVHSSVIIRVNGVYSMMSEFSKAFKCKKHQLMVQPDRCSFYGR